MESERTKSLEDALARVYTELTNSISDEDIDAVHRKIWYLPRKIRHTADCILYTCVSKVTSRSPLPLVLRGV